VRTAGPDFAVFVVSYTLAPHGQYPCQLRQGLAALTYVLRAGGRLPSDIVIGGDSAGGNLVLGMLSHFSHPNSEVYTGPSLQEPLRGAILLSPWVSFDRDWPSIVANRCKDLITVIPTTVNQKWFLGRRERNNYNEPINAPFGWWRGVMAHKMLYLAGADEIMVDSQRLFGERLAVSSFMSRYLVWSELTV
jgi:acetyl esterase/lipase